MKSIIDNINAGIESGLKKAMEKRRDKLVILISDTRAMIDTIAGMTDFSEEKLVELFSSMDKKQNGKKPISNMPDERTP